MGKQIIFCILLVNALPGCATNNYVHDTKNANDFERDKYDCKLVAEQSAANWGAHGNPFMIVEEMKRCLQFKHGWRLQAM